ncbi:DUF2639 domain-containing protein [Priestia megaterium]|nr:DUF2639 domain-containing protein [Priestia megaterium]
MHKFSKGWFVSELKKKNVRHINGRKLELYKAHVLANQYRILHAKSEKN